MLGDTFTAKGLQGAIGKLNIDNLNKLTLTHGTTTNTTQNQSSTNTTDASISSTGSVSAGVGRQQSQSHSNTTTAHDTKLVLGEFNGYAEQTTLHGATIIADGGHYSTDVLNVTTSQNHQTQRGGSKGGNIGVGTSSLNLGYNEQKSQSDITTNNAPSGILYVTTGTAGSAHSLTANHTTVTGGMIAAISQDEQGNQTNSPVNFTTNTLTTQDLLATEYSQNTGFGINVGLTRKQGDTKASSIGLSANNSGHNKQTLTLATIGQGTTITDSIIHNNQTQATTDISQTDINTDALNTQKVIKDQKTGGLDVNTTIDTRVFTTAGRQEIKKEQGEFDGNTKAAFGMFGVAMGATAAGLLDNNENSDSSRLQKIKDNLTQARNNVVTGADKSQASLNAHVDAITDGDLTDALQNQAILNELNAQLTQGTHANGSSVYLTQGTVNDQGQEVKGQANVDRGYTYLNIDYIDTTLETLNHEIAHHNGLGETSATAMGKISDFAYNIGTSLNTDDINTHRQTITPTEKTLQSLSTDEQLAITQDNQALLEANEAQRVEEVESGDGVLDHDPDLRKTDRQLADETRKMNETWAIIQKNKQYILIGTSFIPVVGDIQGFVEAETAGDHVFATIGLIPGLGDAAQKAHKAKKAYEAYNKAKSANDVKGMKSAIQEGVDVLKAEGRATEINGAQVIKKVERGEIAPAGTLPSPKKASERRSSPGKAFSSTSLQELKIGESLFKGGNSASVPKQVADKLSGRSFSNFDEFRSAFWKEMANDPAVAQNFSPQNLALMRQGNAPYAIPTQQVGERKVYELDHNIEIQHGGTIYNLDNIIIRTPKDHINKGTGRK